MSDYNDMLRAQQPVIQGRIFGLGSPDQGSEQRAFLGGAMPAGSRVTVAGYDDVEREPNQAGPRAAVYVRNARVVRIGCQEIYLVETNEGCEVRSSMGTAHLTDADLDILIAELTALRNAAEPGE